MRRIHLLAIFLLVAALPAAADTIVLKNGRRIIATGVTEEGDRVSWETKAGRLSLPRSIVLRVEHNDLSPASAEQSAAAADLGVTAPQVNPAEGYDAVARATVHDGSIDFAYIARLETDTRNGTSDATAKVVAAHHVAAQFLIDQGNLDGGMDHYRRALTYAPDQVALLLNLAALQLRRSEYTAALEPLERARRINPNSADVAKLLGWAFYGANRLDQAVQEWTRAQRIRPDAEVARALAKAERDRAEEASYREGETAHFSLKYYGGATPDLARGILRTLEEHFRTLESELDYSPPEQIGVILYTGQAFADITRAPSWAGALNDGRIRVPVQGLTSVNSELSRVLKHELTHSFVGQKTRNRCPIWLQEGIAQWMEGRRSDEDAAELVNAYDKKVSLPLAALEGSWMRLPGEVAGFAYAWSLAAVESIVQAGSINDIQRLLDRLSTAESTEAALRDVLRDDYADLEKQTATYLRRAYLH